jgi:Uma2 family endonuclease
VLREQWNALTEEQQEVFAPMCPYFAIELRSHSDTLPELQEKMSEYIANGTQLGWLIDPRQFKVHVYRPGRPPEILEKPDSISADPVLPGFTLNLAEVW